jgi:diguanylate cyclase (GGDEF)-like protein
MELSLKELPDACLIIDDHNQIIGINPAGEKLLKIKRADAVGRSVDEVLTLQSFSLIAGVPWDGAGLYPDNEQVRCVELQVSSLQSPDGKRVGLITILRNLNSSSQKDTPRNQAAILMALQETAFDLHSSLELEIVLKNIVRRACKLLGTSHGYLDILNEDADELTPVIGIGALEESLKHKVVKGEGVAGIVWETGKSLVVSYYDQWPSRIAKFRRGAIRAIVGMPLKLDGQVVGVIGVARGAGSEKGFSEGDVEILKRFADLAVVALQNARLYDKAQKEIEFRRNTEVKLRDANQLLQLQIERIELLKAELKEQAVRDSLTELFNRRYLQEMLEMELARSNRSETSLAILMMDSDRLKEINDKYGHKAGDDFLVHIAKVIRKSIRAGDIACRYGGDEFVVMLGNVTEETAFMRADELRKNIATHYILLKKERVSISVSIGIALFPVHGSFGETLLQNADRALYQAKQKGKNHVVVYGEKQG